MPEWRMFRRSPRVERPLDPVVREELLAEVRRERPEEQPLEPEIREGLRVRSVEPEFGLEVIEVPCPDPDCAHIVQVLDRPEEHRFVPTHYPDGKRCWLGGIWWSDALSFVALREENGGRLKRAAHP